MRKLKLFFATFVLLVTGVVAANAESQTFDKPVAPVSPLDNLEGVAPQAGQQYYIYNTGSKTFLGAGRDWGTRAVVTDAQFVFPDGNQNLATNMEYALAFQLEVSGDLFYIAHFATNKSATGDKYLAHEGNAAWVDASGPRLANALWSITASGDGYLITPNDAAQNISFGVDGNNLVSASVAYTWTDLNYSSLSKPWVYWWFIPAATIINMVNDELPVYKAKKALYDQLSAAIDAFNHSKDNPTYTAKEPIRLAINSALETYNGTVSVDAYNSATSTLAEAYDVFVTSGARPDAGYPFDMSCKIVNPSCEGYEMNGWSISKPVGGNGPSLGGTSMEYWAGNASSRTDAGFDYYQEITVPAGKYTVSAMMHNSLNGEEGATFNVSTGVYAAVGETEVSKQVDVDGTTLTEYTTDVIEVGDGQKLRIGVKNFGTMGARWFVADDFRLKLYELDTYTIGSSVVLPQGVNFDSKYFPTITDGAMVEDGQLITLPGETVKFQLLNEEGLISTVSVVKIGQDGNETGEEVTLSQGDANNKWSFEMPAQNVKIKAVYQAAHTISLNVTGTNDMADAPTITVAGATQSGDVAYTAAANSTIEITPEAVDGYSVEVTVTQTPATGGPEETVSASEVSGTWSFTLPDNNVRVSIAYTPIPTYSINGLAYGSQVTIGEVSTTIGDVSTITGVNAGELVTIDVSGVTVSPGMVTMIHANTGAGALTEEALSHVGDVWTFTMPEGDAHLTFAEEYVYSTFTLNVTEGEGMTEAPNVTYSPQFTNAGKVRSGANVTINIPAYAGYDATATYQAASDAEPTTLTISNNQAQLTMPAEDVTATVVYTKHAYTISGLPVDNTTFTIGDTQYESGDVTATEGTVITVTPDLGYQITAITATYTPATGGDPIELTIDDAVGNGKSFTMPAANVTVTCTAEEIVIDPNAIPVTVPALSFVTYVDYNQDLSLATGDQAQLYTISNVTDTEVQLTDQLTSVPSGHHFLIYNPTDADIIAQLMPSAPTSEMEGVGSNWFYLDMNDGTINPDDYTSYSFYICGGKQFLKAIGAGQLADHRWMLVVTEEIVRARNIVFGETTNKITATNIKNATKGDVFDLQGRKVKAPKKGLYIVNGKKAVIK